MKKLRIGSLTEGTLRTDDIWSALICELAVLAPLRAARLVWEWSAVIQGSADTDPDKELLLEELYDQLADYCPPYAYVGAHIGDGAAIGVWPDWDGLDDAVRDGEVWRDPDDGSKIPATARYRMAVSDHGNVSLDHRNGREVWSVV